jgi:hypothetical protein
LKCHAKCQRDYLARHPLTKIQRLKMNARAYAHMYVKRGKIKREGCEVCGKHAELHHDDYSKPTEVRWFCRFHHRRLHLLNA